MRRWTRRGVALGGVVMAAAMLAQWLSGLPAPAAGIGLGALAGPAAWVSLPAWALAAVVAAWCAARLSQEG
jgi:hypothetical protein